MMHHPKGQLAWTSQGGPEPSDERPQRYARRPLQTLEGSNLGGDLVHPRRHRNDLGPSTRDRGRIGFRVPSSQARTRHPPAYTLWVDCSYRACHPGHVRGRHAGQECHERRPITTPLELRARVPIGYCRPCKGAHLPCPLFSSASEKLHGAGKNQNSYASVTRME